MSLELNYEGFEQYLIKKTHGMGYPIYPLLYAFNFGDGYGAIVYTDKDNYRLWTVLGVNDNSDHSGISDTDLVYYWFGISNLDDHVRHLTNEDVLNYLKEIERRKNDETK